MKLSPSQQLIRIYHRILDRLGLPVDYRHFEFEAQKASLPWSEIADLRIAALSRVLDVSAEEVAGFVEEAEEIEAETDHRVDPDGFTGVGKPMGRTDRITLYAATRVVRPRIAVETGTAAGAAALYLLTAMERNGQGELHSIDISQDRANVGRLVPESLRHRIQFYAGDSLQVLGDALADLECVDLFLHDSRHRYRHMMAEFDWALTHTCGRSLLCSHDVLMGNAWSHFTRRPSVLRSAVVKNFGFCVIQGNDPNNP